MGRKRNLDAASNHEADPMNQGESLENFQQDAEESPELLSKYSFEIRIGLSVLGILGFIFAAVVAYRMMKSRHDEISRSKSTETAQLATENESNKTTGLTSQTQGQQPPGESVASPPAFSLDFPNNSGSSSASASPVIGAGNGAAYSPAPGSAWAIPSDPPPGGGLAGNTPTDFNPGEEFSGNLPGTPGSYGPLAPAPPVGNQVPTGANGDSSSPNPMSQGMTSPTSGGNREVRDFFSDADTGLQPSGVSGLSEGPSQATPQGFHPSQALVSSQYSGGGSTSQFPGDFFSGANAVGPPESAGLQPSGSAQRAQPTNETVPSTPFDGSSRAQMATDTARDSFVPATPPFSRADGVPSGQSSGVPRSSGEPGQNPMPYTPPLVASGSNVAASINPAGDNYVMYTVQEGETLFDIARQRLGKASRWVDIYQLNRAQLGERLENFRPGLTLRLPPEGIPPAAASPSTFR